MRRLSLAVLILLVSVWAAPPAQASPVIIDLFTGAPPAVLGGYAMTGIPARRQAPLRRGVGRGVAARWHGGVRG